MSRRINAAYALIQHAPLRYGRFESGKNVSPQAKETQNAAWQEFILRQALRAEPSGLHRCLQCRRMNFVFLCFDAGKRKELVVESLEKFGIPFVDVGMRVYLTGDSLGGMVRTTTSTPKQREHARFLFKGPHHRAGRAPRAGNRHAPR